MKRQAKGVPVFSKIKGIENLVQYPLTSYWQGLLTPCLIKSISHWILENM